MEKYNHREIEAKWQENWERNSKLFSAENSSDKPKKYILDMFPYPSGDGLHVGHVEGYTATDILSRYFRMKGMNVLHPQGWDAFGLPAENYAIKTKVHPLETTKKAIQTFKGQMNRMGFSYDWSREICSADQDYYKWTQWFFLLLYKNRLAYKKKAKVNWCKSCQTVLANEQAEGGICDRCKNQVVQKDLEQWFFKITDFIEDDDKTIGLINGLDKIDWPESTKAAQKNWIGKSEGAQFTMTLAGLDEKIAVYTTRLDTVFGMTYVVVAPEHPILSNLKAKISNFAEVEKYILAARKKTELERTELQKEKTGVKLDGIEIINPFTNEKIPLYVADYVLGGYGTGAVMAVPAHDERDWEFAKKNNLPIKEVIKSDDGKSSIEEKAFIADGILINSGEYDGLASQEAREKMTTWLSENKVGSKKINYRLRDWLVSRQRYWGAPIPIIYCEKCGEVPVPEKDLPVLLPDDVDFMPTGESPLVKSKTFHAVKCPLCGGEARRESDTMDTFVCSSWYYFRYSDPQNDEAFASSEVLKKWLPVDLYVGGAEHTVLHLLYARFFTKVLHRLGYVDFDEPFLKLRHQGIILAEDSRKMSKSFGNVINPDDVVEKYGADALRIFEMFMGPLEAMKPWNTKGIIGISRFLEKVYKLKSKIQDENKNLKILLSKTIQKVSADIENFRFNTAISAMMIFVNAVEKEGKIALKDFEKFLIILAPFAPHLAEELWEKLGYKESIFAEKWPEFDEKLIKDENVEMVVQINGKVRGKFSVSCDITAEEAKQMALSDANTQKWLENKVPKKIIFVKGKLLNIVI
jgi:leucyl-tRNA synthetase